MNTEMRHKKIIEIVQDKLTCSAHNLDHVFRVYKLCLLIAKHEKNVDLEMLDPTGVVVEKWILEGTWLKDVNFDSLSYSQDAIASITAQLRMDRCVLVY